METYFKMRMIMDFAIPIIILIVLVLVGLYLFMNSYFKFRKMEKLGYRYHKGLSSHQKVAYEFQPHWVKGNIRINCRQINNLKYSEIESFVQSKENR